MKLNIVDRGLDRVKVSVKVALHDSHLWMVAAFVNIVWVVALSIFGFGTYELFHHLPNHIKLNTFVMAICANIFLSLIGVMTEALLFSASRRALEGEKSSLRVAFKEVWKKRKFLLNWWIFAAGVQILLALLRLAVDKILSLFGTNLATEITSALFGFVTSMAWGLATYFSVPIVLSHPDKPIPTLKRSAALFKRSWGERAMAAASYFPLFLFAQFAIGIPVMIINGIIYLVYPSVPGIVFLIVYLIFSTTILIPTVTLITATFGLFKASLYQYAETGDYTGPYSKEMLEGAFKRKAA